MPHNRTLGAQLVRPFGRRANTTVHDQTLGAQSCASRHLFGRRANTTVRPTTRRWAHTLRLRPSAEGRNTTVRPTARRWAQRSCAPSAPFAEGRTRRFAPRPDVGRTGPCASGALRQEGRTRWSAPRPDCVGRTVLCASAPLRRANTSSPHNRTLGQFRRPPPFGRGEHDDRPHTGRWAYVLCLRHLGRRANTMVRPTPDVGRTVLCASGTFRGEGRTRWFALHRTLGQSCAPPAPFGRRANTTVRPTARRWAHFVLCVADSEFGRGPEAGGKLASGR